MAKTRTLAERIKELQAKQAKIDKKIELKKTLEKTRAELKKIK